MGPGPISGDLGHPNGGPRNTPILPSSSKPVSPSSHGDPMDITPTGSTSMGPPVNSSPEADPHPLTNGGTGDFVGGQSAAHGNASTAAAASSLQQPKMVNTAFIHKLYNMLEDPTIHELIAWSGDGEGFLMSPSAEFAKVLAQYFKHTNVSSFVRQLNMYGFHKVSDVFHNGQPESALWQFKHGNGSFKRGDLNGLREIKRRASKQTLIHRDSFSGPTPHKPSVSQPGTPAEPMLDPGEARFATLEHNMFDMHARLVRTEESNTALSAKCQALNESLVKAHQWHIEITHMIAALIPDPDNPVRRDASALERDIARQLDMVRSYEDPHESLLSGRQPYFSNMALGEPVSPRQAPMEERRTSLHAAPPRAAMFRPSVSQSHHNMPVPQRRYGSIGTANPLPNYHRPLQPHSHLPPPAVQHPLANVQEPPGNGPNLGRRHTSADIRVPGWPGHNPGSGSPLASGQSSGHWPSSPMQASAPAPAEDQNVRDQLNAYSFGAPRQSIVSNNNNVSSSSHQTTPPSTSNDTPPSTLSADGSSSGNNGPWAHFTANNSNHNHNHNTTTPTNTSNNPKFPPLLTNTPSAAAARHIDMPPHHPHHPHHPHLPHQQQQQYASAPQTRRSSMASTVHSLLNPAETAERDDDEEMVAMNTANSNLGMPLPPLSLVVGGDGNGGGSEGGGKRKRVL